MAAASGPEYIQIVTTVGNRLEAERIARRLVESRLAACVQISGPIASLYHWRGAIESAEEWQCTAKSRRDLFDRAVQAIRDVHSYETPEIIATPILTANDDYLAWLADELLAEKPAD